ncbi:KxYKxGKxW signal peptide domain-containing protein [Xylocopilactobacillus apicola]|uniref:Uncharacterized protein n=1 Tax=Xylocopilactobacillus apicola TaxID=2932184 RepID=A0AAU9DI10_9LACO|nr:KxYKxGKxW signal peptide domain-containing protein [Xylocopilactobacillus apicola]BDR59700.1 hypothetical protein XA3_21410 [Xylocopilactobacillus apicola]
MKLNRNNHFKMDAKVHYKMYKSGKSWVIAGITSFGLLLALGSPASSVKADTKASLAPMVSNIGTAKNSEITRNFSGNPLLRDSSKTFAEQYGTPLNSTNSAPIYGEVKTGKTSTLRYFYGDGQQSHPLSTLYYSDPTGQMSGGRNVSLYGALANFNVVDNGQVISNALYNYGSQRGRIKIGINNNIQTLAAPIEGGQKLWYVGSENGGLPSDPLNPRLNKTLIAKYSSDYLINGKTYTIDYTQTFKPMGSYVNYTISARNVTGLNSSNPNDPSNDIKGLFFESDFDTLFMHEDDSAPMYYIADNAGLYSRGHDKNGTYYRLNYYFTAPTAPTGWKSPNNAYSDAKNVFDQTPDSLGSKVPQGKTPHKEGDLATTATGSDNGYDPGLFMIWKGQDLKAGESRELSYQTGLDKEGEKFDTPKVTLDKSSDDYAGEDYEVTGKVSDSDTSALPLKYYYILDGANPVEFTGPTLTDSSEKSFKFTIKKSEFTTVSATHQVTVYAVDKNNVTSPTVFLKLNSLAHVDTKPIDLVIDEKFDKFAGFNGGTKNDGTILAPNDVSHVDATVVDIKTNQTVKENDYAKITASANKDQYEVQYVYTYTDAAGNNKTTTAKSPITVIVPPTIKAKPIDIMVGSTFDKNAGFDKGTGMNGLPLDMITNEKDIDVVVTDSNNQTITDLSNITKKPGNYTITYTYNYQFGGNKNVSDSAKLTVMAEPTIVPQDVNLFVNDTFDKFDGYKEGTDIKGDQLKHDDVTVVITDSDDNDKVVTDPSTVTKKAGNYKITYTYTYTYNNNPVPVVKVSNVSVVAGNDAKRGADFSLNDPTYYVGDPFKPADGFKEGRKNGTDKMKAGDLQATLDGTPVTDQNTVTQSEGTKTIKYDYYYGNNGQSISKNTSVKVIARKHITLNYVDQHGKSIDTNLLTGLRHGEQSGAYGSDLGFEAAPKLSFNNKDYYKFDHADISGTTETDLSKIKFGDKDIQINLVYKGLDASSIDVNFKDINNPNATFTPAPTSGKTGDKLDVAKIDLPNGYHIASSTELNGKTDSAGNDLKQPDVSFTAGSQNTTVWIVGDTISKGDNNALIVHYYVKDPSSTDADPKPAKDKVGKIVTLKDDVEFGGRVGDNQDLLAKDQTIKGYTLITGDQHYTFKPAKDANGNPTNKDEITFYYKANTQTNITVDFVNINGAGKDIVGNITPQNHFTGDELDLRNDPEIKSAIPNGYQLATDPELKDKGLTRPQNPTYGTEAPKENPIVYVIGKETTASNALTVHHKVKGPNNTEIDIPGMPDITMNGRVGETIKVQPTAPIAGYTLASESKEIAYKFKPDSTGEITFYYTANEQSNVTIKFVNAKNGKTVKTDSPKGKTGDTLDLTSKTAGSYIDNTLKQTGYHYAENGELNGNKQPDKNLEFSTTPQTQTVYVAGDVVDGTSHASSRVTVHHYLKGTTKNVPRMTDTYKGGIIGDNVTVSPDDPEQKAPAGYTIVPNQQPDTWELTADGGHEVTYYYTADSIDNISIQFVNASDPTKKVGMPYIPSGHVTGDNLKVDSDEVKGHVPAGYHVASKAELDDLGSSLTQPELVYGVTSGVQTVYVIGEAQSNITVHFLDAKTLKELGTVTPKENPDSNSNPKASYRTGDVLKLDAASNYVSDFINAHTGYSYTSNSELSSMNLKQPENPTYTTQSQDINVYLSPQSKATHILKVIHKEQLPSTRGVRGLKDFQTSIEEGSDYDFDINDSAHKAPRGYTLIPGQESKLKGTMGTDGKEIILYYAKIR